MNSPTSRRTFLKSSSAAALASAVAGAHIASRSAFAAVDTPEQPFNPNGDTLRVGLIGCGGRGTGAANQALKADRNVMLVAMGDTFESQIKGSLSNLQREFPALPGGRSKVQVSPDRQFTGLDAFQKVIDSGVDVVLLATPPGFRPQHLKAAVEAGKHVFCEKPVATDSPGVRSVLATVEEARRKKLALVAGFCWRYNFAERALFEQILSGGIGEMRTLYGTYYTGPVKPMPPASERKPGLTDLEWQLRNWYNFVWLCGDGLVEQAVHAVDWLCWAMNDVPPLKAVAVGGRQIPNHEGNIYDHIHANYEYAGGVRAFLGCRQISGCANDNTATFYGTKGIAREVGFNGMPFITGEKPWRYRGERPDMYQVEHDELFASIRSGTPINDGVRLAHSTLVAIMGRMAAYTGKEVTWEQALNSKEQLVPENLDWNAPLPIAPMAMPGRTPLI